MLSDIILTAYFTNINNASIKADIILKSSVVITERIKNAIFWDVGPCRSCVNPRFRGKYHLHFPGTKIRERETSVSKWLQTESPLENIPKIYTAPHPRRRHSS
jgi:hypothetical protein